MIFIIFFEVGRVEIISVYVIVEERRFRDVKKVAKDYSGRSRIKFLV